LGKIPAVQVKLRSGELLVIREAAAEDAPELLKYTEKIAGESDFLTFGPGELGITLEQEKAYLAGVASKNNALYIVAVLNGRIVGSLSFAGGSRPRTAHIGEFGVSVLKSHWGKGIGTELIRCLLQWCRESGVIRKVNLRVRADNLRAIQLYKKMGFQEEGMITRQFLLQGKFYDALLMGYAVD